ncbi:MAG: hypothetical protein NXI20_23705 [bacterium]|nr:hypothetical protein [bacterium]
MLGKAIIKYHTKSALKNNRAKRQNISFPEAKEVGILHTYIDAKALEDVYGFFDLLENQGKKVSVIILKDKKQELKVPEFTLVDFQELSNVGKWSDSVQKFFNSQFDYLFHLDLEGSKLTDNILANSKAKCRVGKFVDEKQEFYELMVRPEADDLHKLIQQIYQLIKRF